MKEKVDKIRVQKTLLKRDLPDSYYVIQEVPLAVDDLRALLVEQHKYLAQKALLNANRRLHLDLDSALKMEDVVDLVHDTFVVTLRQLETGTLVFYSKNKFLGYVLLGAWRAIRDEQRRHSHEVTPVAEGDFSFREYRLVPLDLVADPVASPRASRGSLDLRDDYQQHLWTSLWENLSEAVATRKLQFRDVAIYKHYMLNKYAIADAGAASPSYTIAKMAEETDFSVKQINTALKSAKVYVADYVAKLKPPSDLDCEEEAEDIFGY